MTHARVVHRAVGVRRVVHWGILRLRRGLPSGDVRRAGHRPTTLKRDRARFGRGSGRVVVVVVVVLREGWCSKRKQRGAGEVTGHGGALSKWNQWLKIIQSAIAIMARFSVNETNPSGTLLDPPTHAHLISRF